MLLLMILNFVGFSSALLGNGTIQSIAVTGSLFCDEEPAADVKVVLYDRGLTFDVKMDEGRTNQTGGFYLSSKAETTIDPIMYIYHKCNYGGPCYRRLGFELPQEYVTEGNTPDKTFNIGTINLAGQFIGEVLICYI